MKESVGYTVTINIMVTFIVILFAFLSAIIIYFKSNKVSKLITETIEKYEGYNLPAKNEISTKLTSIGYNKKRLNSCGKIDGCKLEEYSNDGYCVYVCDETPVSDSECYYYYKIRTNMVINVPLINQLIDVPVFSDTVRLYDFEKSKNKACNVREGGNP